MENYPRVLLVLSKCCSAIAGGKGDKKKETKLGLSTSKAEDFGAWYSEVVIESEMISYYDVSGALSPPSHALPCRVVIAGAEAAVGHAWSFHSSVLLE